MQETKQAEIPSQQVPLKHWLIILGTIIGAFMAILDIQITSSSIKEIAGALSIPVDQSSNISTAYLIAELICISLTAWLVRAFSLKRTLIYSIVIFMIASLACSCAWNLSSMIIFRALQGFAGAPLIPLALSVVMRFLPKEKQMTGIAIFGLTATLAPTLGPTIGGWITDNLSWKYLFYINIFPSVVALIMIGVHLDKQPVNTKVFTQINIFAVILIAIGLGTLEYVLENGSTYNWFDSNHIIVLSIIAFISLSLFFVVDTNSQHPLIKLQLFTSKKFTLGCINYFLLGIMLYGSVFITPLYLVLIHQYSSMEIGLVFFWQGFPQLICMPLIPLISKYVDSRILVIAGYLILAASFLLIDMDPDYSGQQMKFTMLVRGIGLPFTIVPLSSVVLFDIEAKNMDDAASITSIMRNLGGALGVAIITTLIIHGRNAGTKTLSTYLPLTKIGAIEWLRNTEQLLIQQGADSHTASLQAHALLMEQMRMNATIIAFNDIYFLLGILLLGCSLSILAFFDWSKLFKYYRH